MKQQLREVAWLLFCCTRADLLQTWYKGVCLGGESSLDHS